MKTSEIKKVVILDELGHKYIVATLTDSDENEIFVLRGGEADQDHPSILKDLKAEISDLNVTIHGGGRISVDTVGRTCSLTETTAEPYIMISGTSGNFGSNRKEEETLSLLKETYPQCSVEVSY
ncbi:hypothetical protein COB55_04950 [Candidatus Wolfebacteria bacterium]|nr:MAG: hypothetical protein COB55_04950 [Candidatus Wolfebacteria bacterium]